jgi:hypothetical protein
MSKKQIKEKLEEWSKMSNEEKLKYNGFNGFVNGETKSKLFGCRV